MVDHIAMQRLTQSPTEPGFVQDPYPFYERARSTGDLIWWEEYDMPAAVSFRAVSHILRHRRFGREAPAAQVQPVPERLAPFYDIEAHSMLEAEPPRHTRLRRLVLRAFTSSQMRRITPMVDAITSECLEGLPRGQPFDLLDGLARPLPITVIVRLLGVPETRAPDMLRWSNAMVGMYQARRSRQMEDAAVEAAKDFRTWLTEVIAERRTAPDSDLLSDLIAVEETGDQLSLDELIATTILLLNAGHEATVHTIGNGVRAILQHSAQSVARDPHHIDTLIEEILRYDPPLHLFTRYAYEETEVFGHTFQRGDQVALLLASANRDPTVFRDADRFDPTRPIVPHASFGAGIHFCLGAPLARLELARALPALFRNCPHLVFADTPRCADIYHFRGLERLLVNA